MRVLFIHQNFPGQYRHLAAALAARPGTDVLALTRSEQPAPAGVRVARYSLKRGNGKDVHPLATEFETKVIRGEATAEAAIALKEQGYTPDIICAHPGWGESLFLKDVWSETPMLAFLEFYYRSIGSDVGFDPEFDDGSDVRRTFRTRVKNANNLLALETADWGVSPTRWQRAQLPARFRERVTIAHDGIDTDAVRPDPAAEVRLDREGAVLKAGDEVVTFVNRNLEPYRGYHTFMRSLPKVLAARPNARVLIVGGETGGYGALPPAGTTWKTTFLDEVRDRIDLARVHFLGRVPYGSFVRLLQISRVHVYLTYPFVLSWSMLEAMAAGALVIGSDTPPVTEILKDGDNGLVTDFFDADALADRTIEALAQPERFADVRVRARETIVRDYDLKRVCLPRHMALVDAIASGLMPRPEDGIPGTHPEGNDR